MNSIIILFENEISIDSLFAMAEIANEHEVTAIIPIEFKEFVELEWDFGCNADVVFCKSYLVDSVLFSLNLIKNNQLTYKINESGGKTRVKQESEIELEYENLNEIYSNIHLISNYNQFSDMEKNIDFKSKLNYFLSLISKIKRLELDLLLGKSKLNKSDISIKKDATSLELLGVGELISLENQYTTHIDYYGDEEYIVDYLSGKSDKIKSFYSNSFKRNGKCVEMLSFPVAYKYFSVLLYISATEMFRSGNYSSAYVMYFRSFEVYCEGFLISQGTGKIDRYIDDYNNIYNDCFLILNKDNNYIKPMGFGIKWSVIRRFKFTNTMDKDLLQKIELHRKLRNVNVLTHGDAFIPVTTLIELQESIVQAIDYFEVKFTQDKFNWNDLLTSMKGHFIYNIKPHLGKMLLSSYKVSSITLKN
ncbi:hypothetical protein [Vibrio splendidus]|uniref:hypothetical protein n=1 Tax=Vibrio splendidus TaxID=29497 RepID=UPI001C078B99|nr:hypothetical protein [Vibrio splendidus]MBU2908525.1 hypothetical protein [Vibrio splendidus]MDO6531687.1 hypothetical protein [Vibrio splendidus]MDO6552782.1 hypothetical protein [Vibrio splendidus]